MTADGGLPGAGRRALGILGGTFDPVHLGHLALAREALTALELDHVLFVPNGDPPHKRGQEITPPEHRAAMVSLAIDDEPAFVLSRLELDRPGPSYAIDTVTEIARQSRSEGRPEPWFILSAEALDDLPSWREPLAIVDRCRLAVAPRPGAAPVDAAWLARQFPGRSDRFRALPGPRLDIASTTIRERVADGLPIDGLVPDAVARYIAATGLYRRLETQALAPPGGMIARG